MQEPEGKQDLTPQAEGSRDKAAPGKTPSGYLQRKATGGGSASGSGTQQIAADGFSGSPSPVPFLSQMEAGYGMNFSGVQVYSGGPAAEANSKLGSEAYAVGQQVAFKSPNPSPAVVAHELAHTIQQGAAGPVQTWSEGREGDGFEAEADHAAAAVLAGEQASVTSRTGPVIQKWSGADHYTLGNTAGQKALSLFQGAFRDANPGAPRVVIPERRDGSSVGGGQANLVGGGVRTGERGSSAIGSSPSQTTLGLETNNGGLISMGSASRLSGDYEKTPGGLAQRNTETKGSETLTVTTALATNANHFFPVHRMEYQNHHRQAIAQATAAYQFGQQGVEMASRVLMRSAMREEAFANHFLQDTYASGHMAPRSLDSIGQLTNETPGTVERTMYRIVQGGGSIGRSVGSVPGQAVGGVLGGLGGFVGSALSWENPFRGAARGARSGARTGGNITGAVGEVGGYVATSPFLLAGGAANIGSKVDANVRDAAGGLLRTRNWHDFFCALPNGLPTSLGRFHGDHNMDGNDLAVVSDTCANSIMEVLSAGQGQPRSLNVAIPTPDFAGIMADPQAGPVWRLMMQDYASSLAAARAEVTEEARGSTDGGTTIQSREVVDEIYRTTFGGAAGVQEAQEGAGLMGVVHGVQRTQADAARSPIPTVNAKRAAVKGSLDNIDHYASMAWGQNRHLGRLNDDLDVPESSDPNDTGFDPVMLERTFGLYSALAGTAREFSIAAGIALGDRTGLSSGQTNRLQTEMERANEISSQARRWAELANMLWQPGDDTLSSVTRGNAWSVGRRPLRAQVRAGVSVFKPIFDAGGEYEVLDSRLDVPAGDTAVA